MPCLLPPCAGKQGRGAQGGDNGMGAAKRRDGTVLVGRQWHQRVRRVRGAGWDATGDARQAQASFVRRQRRRCAGVAAAVQRQRRSAVWRARTGGTARGRAGPDGGAQRAQVRPGGRGVAGAVGAPCAQVLAECAGTAVRAAAARRVLACARVRTRGGAGTRGGRVEPERRSGAGSAAGRHTGAEREEGSSARGRRKEREGEGRREREKENGKKKRKRNRRGERNKERKREGRARRR